MPTPSITHNSSPSQHRPQDTNFQRKKYEMHKDNQTNSKKYELSCDACHKVFPKKKTLDAHLECHVQCSYDGCSFEASSKVLKFHWNQFHASGKVKIKLDTPEEIAKWREERKRKYPTVANVEKKKEEEAKRKASGQVLRTKNFRYRRGQRGGKTSHRGRRRQHQGKRKGEMNDQVTTANSENGSQEGKSEDSESLKNEGDPLSFVLGDCDGENESDTEGEMKEKLSSISRSPSTLKQADISNEMLEGNSALGSLFSAYASDSDNDEEQTGINNEEMGCGLDEGVSEKPDISKDLESMPQVTSEEGRKKKSRQRRLQKRKKKQSQSEVNSRSLGMRKSTLLEKLLAPQIRHERNVILQCVRHIIKKNFFDVEETKSSTQ